MPRSRASQPSRPSGQKKQKTTKPPIQYEATLSRIDAMLRGREPGSSVLPLNVSDGLRDQLGREDDLFVPRSPGEEALIENMMYSCILLHRTRRAYEAKQELQAS